MGADVTVGVSSSSSGVSKVTFILSWKTANPGSGDIFAGSSRGDGASGKLSFESGLDWTDDKITLQHDLNTEYLDISILDVAGDIQTSETTSNAGTNQYLDIGATAEVTVKYLSANKIQLWFNDNSSISAGSIFKIMITG